MTDEPHEERRLELQPLAPTTTVQQDVTQAGQRRINAIWEYTQAAIALSVVLSNLIVGVGLGLGYTKVEFPLVLSNTMFLVVGFYFSRTNHQAIGGIGPKPDQSQPYKGR